MNIQLDLFPPSAVTGTGRLLGDWPITRAALAPVPDSPVAAPTQAEELPLDRNEEAA